MRDTLIIVDMQQVYLDFFTKRIQNRLIKNILAEIPNYKRVILLEMDGEGDTIEPIKNKVPNSPVVYKYDMNGGKELDDFFQDNNIVPKGIYVCGIFREQCVSETSYGLRRVGYNHYILEHCSEPEGGKSQVFGKKRMSRQRVYKHEAFSY